MKKKLMLVGISCCALAGSFGCSRAYRCWTIVENAKVWTGDPQKPAASVLVVDPEGRFCYVGDDLQAARARVVRSKSFVETIKDVEGARIIPGLIDAHMHLISGGLQLSRINLRDVPDRNAFVQAVANRARTTPRHLWITGGRWSTESWTDRSQPDRTWIDAVTPDHPVLLSRMDGHGALANTVALRIAGIDKNGPPDPPGGAIVRDPATHEPTGQLKDTAIDLVARHVPPTRGADTDAALAAAIREANSHGLTCVHTMSSWSDVAALDRARARHRLSLRVRVFVQEDDPLPFLDRAAKHEDDDWVAIRGFKQYADGSLGSRTAYMVAPFLTAPGQESGNKGLLRERLKNPADFLALCKKIRGAGYPVVTHAIGDQANHLVLDAYESALAGNSTNLNSPYRIEHAQHLLPADIPRFARLGVVASMQPLHKADDGRYAESYIGTERCKTSYAFRSLLDSGATLAFGSDWPVVSLNPFLGIAAAVTGRTLDGKTFVPEQNLTIEQALRAYTSGAAHAAGDGEKLGQIVEGIAADFVILKDDPFSITPERLGDVRIQTTFVQGNEVFSAD